MNDYYQLSKEIVGHEQDVKGVDYNTLDGSILSVSRDGSLRVNGDKIYLTTNKFLNCVKYLPKSEKNDEYYLSAGSAKTVYIHHPQQLDSAIMRLTGHNDNICCIDLTEDHRIVTGSWDKTIKVWKDFNLQFTFFGHEQAVWAVKYLKSKQWIVSGSADKTIKVWDPNTGNLIHTIQAHTDCVRSIDEVENLGFISCGNDGVVKVWDYSFNLIQELHGHTSFVYSVQTIDPEQFLFASSGEDRSVRIWKEGKCIQTITLPALSIWTLKVLPNQNIVAGSSDSVVRVFTKIQEEVADNDTLKAFEEKVGQQSINTNQVGDIQKEKLEGIEGLQRKGNKEGEVKMIRNNLNNVEAYQWSMNNQEWVKIGEVVDAVGNSRKQLYQGKEYDYVFDINLSEGAPNLKLPYNVVDNPFTVAMNFIQQNQLPVEYLDQIVQFINQNGKPITIDSSTNNNNSNFTNPDPYTGSNRNKSISSSTTTTSTIINEKINYTKINIDQVMNKFNEFNLLQSDENKLEQDNLQLIHQTIKNTAGKSDEMKQVIQLLLQQFVKVNKEYKFPILDLLRYLSSFIDLEKEFNVMEYLNNHLYSNIKPFDKMTDILLMISFKLTSNLLLVNQNNNGLVYNNVNLLLQQLNVIEPFISQSSINCNLAYSSIFVNLSQLNPNVTKFTVENINEFLLLLNELLLIDHEELNYRSFVAIYNVYLNYQKYQEDIGLLLEQLEMPTRIQKEFVVKYKNNTKISGLLNKLHNLL